MFFEDSETKEYPLMPQELEAIDKWHLMLIDFTFNAGLPVQHALTAYNLYKKSKSTKNRSSHFGLIEETMDTSNFKL